MRARRIAFLVLATAYLCAVAFGVAVFFVDDRDAMRGVPAMLVTVPWSLVLGLLAAILPSEHGDLPSALFVVFICFCGGMNVAILALILRPFRPKGSE